MRETERATESKRDRARERDIHTGERESERAMLLVINVAGRDAYSGLEGRPGLLSFSS